MLHDTLKGTENPRCVFHSRIGIISVSALCLLSAGCPADPGGTTIKCDEEKVAAGARAILQAYCYRCHGQTEPFVAGLNVMDVNSIKIKGLIVPGDPDESRLYQRVQKGEMPPQGESPRPSDQEWDVLREWISCNAIDFNKPANRPFVPIEDVLRSMRTDIETVPSFKRKFIRYFVLTNLYNAGVDDASLERYRAGLHKIVNSLSWSSNLTVPIPIDAPINTVYRIDLTDYRWEPQVSPQAVGDLWETLLAHYPFGALYVKNPDAVFLEAETGTQLPWVFGDWFSNEASAPPLYHLMLRLPDNVNDLEKRIGVDATANIVKRIVKRAGFDNSGVSSNNRVIERHSSLFGAYWKSYDCQTSIDDCDIFNNPVGPPTIPPGPNQFVHDGGEFIFTLPNGFHGFMIGNAQGARLDSAPQAIVFDPTQPGAAVRSGRSCMGCHIDGIQFKDDMIRAYVVENSSLFSNDVVAMVKEIYPPNTEFNQIQAADRDAYVATRSAIGYKDADPEPVGELANDHARSLDLRRAAAELWVTPDALVTALGSNPLIASKLGPLTLDLTVKREVFRDAFPVVVCAIGAAIPLKPVKYAGLVAWWPGDGSTDEIISGNNGVPKTTIQFEGGKVEQAFYFNSPNSAVVVSANPQLQVKSITIDAWIFPEDVGGQRPIVEYAQETGAAGVHFWINTLPVGGSTNTGTIYANLRDASGGSHQIGSGPGVIKTHAWQHVAMTYDQLTGEAALYVNGIAVVKKNLGSFQPQTSYPVNIGRRPEGSADGGGGASVRFIGKLDEIDIWDRALSSDDIVSIFESGSSGKCKRKAGVP